MLTSRNTIILLRTVVVEDLIKSPLIALLFVVVVEFGLYCESCGCSSPTITHNMSRWIPIRSRIHLFPIFEGRHVFSLVLRGGYSMTGRNPTREVVFS